MTKNTYFFAAISTLFFLISSCTSSSSKSEKKKYTMSVKEQIERLESIKGKKIERLVGFWKLDSMKDENSKSYTQHINTIDSFLIYDFQQNNSIDAISNYNDLGILSMFYSKFKIINNSLYFYSQMEELCTRFKFDIINDKVLVLYAVDNKTFKHFSRYVSYLSRTNDEFVQERTRKNHSLLNSSRN